MSQRYIYSEGAYPELRQQLLMSGPQFADQVPGEIRKLLDRKGITGVAIFYSHIPGYHKVDHYAKMEENQDADREKVGPTAGEGPPEEDHREPNPDFQCS